MTKGKFSTTLKNPWVYFALVFIPTLAVFILYGYNIIRWRNSPDFGWRAMYESGPNVIADLFERGRAAGLRVGDYAMAINGRAYSTFEELFFEIRNEKPGSVNRYTIRRDGQEVEIAITTGKIGIGSALKRSGPLFFLGFVYFMIGTVVFFMKPKARESFIFLLQTSFLGAMICYQSPSDLFRPLWLFDVRNFIEVFMPAPMIHLSLRFPRTRSFLIRSPKLVAVPYLLAFILFVLIRINSTAYWNIPRGLNHVYNVSIMVSVLTFIFCCIWNFIRDRSAAVRLQSQAILVGIFIGFFIPVADLLLRSYINVYVFPDPVIGFMAFLTAFPLSIGYTIVKHDLFAIDAIIKRTYGYILTTGAIAGIYALVVVVSHLIFGEFEITKSPAFPIIFILAVVMFFNPVRNRVQHLIDRVFYRLEYDYQEVVHKISETMRTLLDVNEIGRSMIGTALSTLFVDRSYVLLLNKDLLFYEGLEGAGEEEAKLSTSLDSNKNTAAEVLGAENQVEGGLEITELKIPSVEPLIGKIAESKKEVTIYDIEVDPRYEDNRESYRRTFERMKATLLVPLIYEKQLTGLLALGRKKSGKFFRREDINLLNILANQGAVAIENARNVEKILEKERIRVRIMDAFGKYVTREVRDQILEGRIPLDGENKEVTVLFADLRDFTTLTESTPPKEVVKIINGYFSEMAGAIGRNRGLILQFIGDEIEAVFGAPADLDDHPTHAVRAALEMRKQLSVVNARLFKEGYGPLHHGIGVHTGTVVAANIGSEDRLSYAMVGDTVNLTSRIQDLNKQFDTEILVSSTTVSRLTHDFALEKLPATTVKGKKEPVEVYKLL